MTNDVRSQGGAFHSIADACLLNGHRQNSFTLTRAPLKAQKALAHFLRMAFSIRPADFSAAAY